jgi:thiazole synthase
VQIGEPAGFNAFWTSVAIAYEAGRRHFTVRLAPEKCVEVAKNMGFLAYHAKDLLKLWAAARIWIIRVGMRDFTSSDGQSSTVIEITLNGAKRRLADGLTVRAFLASFDFDVSMVALERNLEIVPRSRFDKTVIENGDQLEVVSFIGGGNDAALRGGMIVAGKTYQSRLIVGTGKYKDFEETAAAVEASGAEIVTVAVRRVNISDPGAPMITNFVDPKKYTYLPNTAGCFSADDAVRTLRLAREAGGWNLVKLEVLGDQKTLYPNMPETFVAAKALIKDGFQVMAYVNDDPIAAKTLEEMGCVAIMPLGAPIGSGLGLQNRINIRLIVEAAGVPVLVDAGVGTASDATIAMELGCDGVLMNTAIAEAKDPIKMARAMRHAVEAGRLAYLAGRMGTKKYADPSSPLGGLI